MSKSWRVGETVRVSVRDLLRTTVAGVSSPVTSGATVTLAIIDSTGAVLSSATGIATDDDWSAEMTLPATIGIYRVRASVVASGATWKDLFEVLVWGDT
jgi:hypothetical protein